MPLKFMRNPLSKRRRISTSLRLIKVKSLIPAAPLDEVHLHFIKWMPHRTKYYFDILQKDSGAGLLNVNNSPVFGWVNDKACA